MLTPYGKPDSPPFLSVLARTIADELLARRAVHLGDIGSFQVVHRFPERIESPDGRVELTPPADVLEFSVSDARGKRTSPTAGGTLEGSLMLHTGWTPERVEEALAEVMERIRELPSGDERLDVDGVGAFRRKRKGKLVFDTDPGFALMLNHRHAALKPVVIMEAAEGGAFIAEQTQTGSSPDPDHQPELEPSASGEAGDVELPPEEREMDAIAPDEAEPSVSETPADDVESEGEAEAAIGSEAEAEILMADEPEAEEVTDSEPASELEVETEADESRPGAVDVPEVDSSPETEPEHETEYGTTQEDDLDPEPESETEPEPEPEVELEAEVEPEPEPESEAEPEPTPRPASRPNRAPAAVAVFAVALTAIAYGMGWIPFLPSLQDVLSTDRPMDASTTVSTPPGETTGNPGDRPQTAAPSELPEASASVVPDTAPPREAAPDGLLGFYDEARPGAYTIGLGEFTDIETVTDRAIALLELELRVHILPLQRGDRTTWRLIVGQFDSREQAQQAQTWLPADVAGDSPRILAMP